MVKKKYLIFIIAIVIIISTLLWLFYNKKPNSASERLSPTQTTTATNTPLLPESIFSLPIANFKAGQTKKHFGQYITPQNSPVQPERFTGYHTGVDIEESQDNTAVPVLALADSTVRFAGTVGGYGGVVILQFNYQKQDYLALYGHLRLSSVTVKGGDKVQKGSQLALLGNPNSVETAGERKHLHLGIIKGTTINYRGYVAAQSALSAWLDPNILIY